MTILSRMGEFPEAVLGLAFSLACALLLGFVCLKFLVGLVTRDNVTDDPRRVRVVLWLGGRHRSASATSSLPADDGSSRAAGVTYLLPAAAAPNRFNRAAESFDSPRGRVVELSEPVRSGAAKSGR